MIARLLSFWVPDKPVAYTRVLRSSGGEARARRYFAYRDLVVLKAREAGARAIPAGVPVRVVVEGFVLDRKFDADNLGKGILDALTGECYADDKQVVDIHTTVVDLACAGPQAEGVWVRVGRADREGER